MIQDVLRKLGQWSITLAPDAPPGVISALDWFGHVAVIPARLNPLERGDECLTLARYVGVLRSTTGNDAVTLSGSGMAYWLGDENGVGDLIENPGIQITGQSFADSVRALLPTGGAVTEGALSAIAGTYTGFHQWQTPRSAIDYVCDYFVGDWRVNGTGTLDAGPATTLFRSGKTIIARRDVAGYDMQTRALDGDLETTRDVSGYATRAVVVADGYHIGDATAGTVPYKDIHGNPVKLTKVADEQDSTQAINADVRAALVLNQYSGVRRSLRLQVSDFDVAGDVAPGDTVYVWDPANNLTDPTTEVMFRGRLLNPATVRVLSVSWPVTSGYTVAYRSSTGVWTDLTSWVQWESGDSGEVEVADSLNVPLTSSIGSLGTAVSGANGGGDSSIPGVPTFGTFTGQSYQPSDGLSKAAVQVTWTQPLNTDGSTITDGDHYEVQYRPTGTTNWDTAFAGWDHTSLTVTDLPPSTGFDWQIRAVDYAAPINYGAWSATTTYSTPADTTAPATPAAPSVASSQLAVQVTHTLGLASGGTYNLPLDLDHLEVHGGASSGFTTSTATLLGKLPANAGMLTASIPAIGTFDTTSVVTVFVKVVAVDKTGNRSTSSAAGSATATLIDNAHITDLVVSKLTAGTMTAAVILGGSIKTATTGARTEQDSAGVRLYNSGGTLTVDLNTSTGTATLTGKVQTGTTGSRVIIDPATTGVSFYPSSGSAMAAITGIGVDFAGGGPTSSAAWLDARSSPGQASTYSNLLLSSYGTGTVYSAAMLAARNASNVTNAWAHIYNTSTDGIVSLGTADNSAVVVSNIRLVNTGIYLTAPLLSGVVGSSSLDLTTTQASLYAGGGGNAFVQSSGGSYFSANNTNAYVNAPNGVFITGAAAGTAISFNASGGTLQCGQGTDTVVVGASGGICALAPADVRVSNITTGTGTAIVHISRRLYIQSSSLRYKTAIEDATVDPADVLALRPITYVDKSAVEENGGVLDDTLPRHLGLIAEEIAGGPLEAHLVYRDDEGLPSSLAYDRLPIAQQFVLTDHEARLRALEAALTH